MAAFWEQSSVMLTKLHANVAKFKPRGGASIVEVNDRMIIFGGADREQTHFQDIAIYQRQFGGGGGKVFQCETTSGKTSGDIPMPRSGHTTAAFGKYMFLFGGIDFKEEAVFNDLYLLDTESLEWHYVGEAGAEIIGRNSHSMGIITVKHLPQFQRPTAAGAGVGAQTEAENIAEETSDENDSYLVVYGGASPEHGPLADTFYAKLPRVGSYIDPKTFFVTWVVLSADSLPSKDSTLFTQEQHTAANKKDEPLLLDLTSHLHNSLIMESAAAVAADAAYNGEATAAGMDRMDATPSTPLTAIGAVPSTATGVKANATTFTAKHQERHPGKREMHATCCYKSAMYVCGGRNSNGEILQDMWRLRDSSNSWDDNSDISRINSVIGGGSGIFGAAMHPLVWERVLALELPTVRCAHGFAITSGSSDSGTSTSSTAAAWLSFHIFGGFTGGGIDGELISAVCSQEQLSQRNISSSSISPAIATTTVTTPIAWRVVPSQSKLTIPERFGLSLCAISASMALDLSENNRYKPLFSASCVRALRQVHDHQRQQQVAAVSSASAPTKSHAKPKSNTTMPAAETTTAAAPVVPATASSSEPTCLMLFGGVNADCDFGDIWILLVT